MDVNLTTLCENTAVKPGFAAEWGLSILIETGDLKILFDTGENTAAVYNARKFGIDLSALNYIVFSHGHGDHTGGLREVLKYSGPKPIYAHPDIWHPKYTKRPEEKKEAYIGIPFIRDELEFLGAAFNLSREPQQITENIMTTGEVPMVTDYEIIEPNLFVREKGELKPDPLFDDSSLIIKSENGLIIILGCAHRGMINIIRHSQKITGEEQIYAVIGGTHLGPASEERLEKTIKDLKEINVEKIGVSHCTGFKASSRLANLFPDKFFLNNAGTRITL
ncbi:MAG: MBL fold metallo-hydrolase [Desulfitobacteriaceae bacterium]|nr:MBL fold metallo-hydrolase [Desulfitobacteriaceae bacterium]MDD4753458.1 MBL fold metallo-hydrolase [Desulfitobacteriaceae bacterium]